jgi:DNA-directed RNA polymerase specialized sigma24 family protein
MSKAGPTKETFEKLLAWLDPDRERAGEKYENIRLRLIRIFCSRGCYDAEDLADQTMNVVASRIDWLIENFTGNPALYFYGVAKKIYKEQLTKKKKPPPEPPRPDNTVIERECGCLEECLKQQLPPGERQLVLRYHQKEKQEKIRLRKQIASELGITINALRIRVHHIHARLRPCIEQCLQHLLEQ